MIIVDTSVLSLALRRRPRAVPEPALVRIFRRLVAEDQPIAVPGIVLQELLSGVRSADEFDRLRDLMDGFPQILATHDHHVSAARISNTCRQAGITVSAVDCLIAAMAVENNSQLLSGDADFERMAPHCGLRPLPPIFELACLPDMS